MNHWLFKNRKHLFLHKIWKIENPKLRYYQTINFSYMHFIKCDKYDIEFSIWFYILLKLKCKSNPLIANDMKSKNSKN